MISAGPCESDPVGAPGLGLDMLVVPSGLGGIPGRTGGSTLPGGATRVTISPKD
jgi:hypothetical protein